MRVKTQLEYVIESNPHYRGVVNSVLAQRTLDVISEEVCAQLRPEDILDHTKAVYDETALMYVAQEDHRIIIPELLDFMELPELPHGSRILDLGCGPVARDTLFLTNVSHEFRAVFMARRKGGLPLSLLRIPQERAYRVTAVDGSPITVSMAQLNFVEARKVLRYKGELTFTPEFALADMHDLSSLSPVYNGVWSCTALFTHTPRALVGQALRSVARVLVPKGVFGVSYPCGAAMVSYDHLLASRTGRIKYFSRPRPGFIAQEAFAAGLDLIMESPSDLVRDGVVTKDFFITQFFRKQ